jgi:hypothetical protein
MNDPSNPVRTVALSEADAAQTLPLAQVTWPGVDLDHWRNYIRSYTAGASKGASGIIALRDASDYFSAMFAYRLDLDVRRGSVLMVQLFTAVDLANSPTFTVRLLTAAEAKARELDCASVEIRLYRGQSNLAMQLRTLGLTDGGAIVSKLLDGPRAA